MAKYDVMLENGDFDGNVVDVPELLGLIRDAYGDLDNECGCYCNRSWLSIKDIVRMIVESSYPND